MTKKTRLFFGILISAAVLAACAGPSANYRRDLNRQIALGDYSGALKNVEDSRKKEYGDKNALLYFLDKGTVQQLLKDYDGSDKSFETAEEMMNAAYTKSISRGAGTLIVNDNTTVYGGKPYERAFLNISRAINFVLEGERQDAIVEANKVTDFLYDYSKRSQGKSAWKDSAFAQYLSAMLYEENGDFSDAAVCYGAAVKAYGGTSSVNETSMTPNNTRPGRIRSRGPAVTVTDNASPAPVLSFTVPSYKKLGNDGEVVLIHYNGPSPVKVSRTMQVAWNNAVAVLNSDNSGDEDAQRARNAVIAGGLAGGQITVSYPEYEQDPYFIHGSELSVDGVGANSILMEDIARIMRQDLRNEYPVIWSRAVVRAVTKYILSEIASKSVENSVGGDSGKAWGMFTKIVTGAVSAGTEVADTRGWSTLPAEIRMARLAVPAGKHSVRLSLLGQSGQVVEIVEIQNVEVKAGRRTYLLYRSVK